MVFSSVVLAAIRCLSSDAKFRGGEMLFGVAAKNSGGLWRAIRVLFFLVLGLLGVAKQAMAVPGDCTVSDSYPGMATHVDVWLPSSLRLGINTQEDQILFDSGWRGTADTGEKVYCSGSNNIKYTFDSRFNTGMVSSTNGNEGVFRTGLAGVGIRIYASNDLTGSNPVALSPATGTWVPVDIGTYGPMATWKVQLVATSTQPVPGTTVLPTSYNIGWLFYGSLPVSSVRVMNNTTVAATSCSVNTPSNRTVNMAPISAGSFAGVGDTAGNGSFTISLTCMWGTKVYMTMTDATNPGNTSNALSLTAASTARGIGYQISHANGVVSYGPDSDIAGNLNQFYVATSGGSAPSTMNIPFGVKYVRTGTVSPGSANAIATYNMSYQ